MKTKLFFIGILGLSLFPTLVFGQRYNKIGYIDMDYILNNLAQYEEANQQIDHKIEGWKEEIEKRKQKIADLRNKLENERPLLTQDLIQERENEIEFYENRLIKYQQQRFGPGGDLDKERQDIVKPIQSEVFNAVQEIGLKQSYDFIFDNSSEALMLFSAKRHNISDQVLNALNRTQLRQEREKMKIDRAQNGENDASGYKTVQQSQLGKEKRAKRAEQVRKRQLQRQNEIEKRKARIDSLRNARTQKLEIQREEVQKERETQRTSAREKRLKLFKARQHRLDSLRAAKKLQRIQRKRERDSLRAKRQKARENRKN